MKHFCAICKEEIKDGVIRLMQPDNRGQIIHYHITCKKKVDKR
ncbi:hypothetical protein ABFV99_14620 [Cytobacillus horneckiae]